MFQLVALGKQGRSQRRAGKDVAEIAVRKLHPGRPVPAAADKGIDGGGERLATHIGGTEQRRRASKGGTNVPVLVAQVHLHAIALLRVLPPRARYGSFEAAFLRVPTQQGFDVDGGMAEIEVLGINRLPKSAAKS